MGIISSQSLAINYPCIQFNVFYIQYVHNRNQYGNYRNQYDFFIVINTFKIVLITILSRIDYKTRKPRNVDYDFQSYWLPPFFVLITFFFVLITLFFVLITLFFVLIAIFYVLTTKKEPIDYKKIGGNQYVFVLITKVNAPGCSVLSGGYRSITRSTAFGWFTRLVA